MWQQESAFNDAMLWKDRNTRIADLSVKAEWDPDHQEGRFDIDLVVHAGADCSLDRLFVRAVVRDPHGGIPTIGSSRLVAEVPWLMPATQCGIGLFGSLPHPWFWTQESLQSYYLWVVLEDRRGQIVDAVTGRFGICMPVPDGGEPQQSRIAGQPFVTEGQLT